MRAILATTVCEPPSSPDKPEPIPTTPGSRAPAVTLTPEQQKTRLRQHYGTLFRDLALSDAEANALLDALTQQAQRVGRASAMAPRAPDAPENAASRAQEREALEAAVGPQKAAQFEQLRGTLLARSEMRVIRDRLEEVGQPLSDGQLQKLLADSRGQVFELPVRSPGEADYGARIRSATQTLRQQIEHSADAVLTHEQREQLNAIKSADDAERAQRFLGHPSASAAGHGAQP
ncbi:MAG: hypothetical protein ABW321_16575 [Polyangiales bacterium]